VGAKYQNEDPGTGRNDFAVSFHLATVLLNLFIDYRCNVREWCVKSEGKLGINV
jgi:hypothetical protein